MAELFFGGMQFAFKRSNSPVAYCSVTVKAGTRNEKNGENGIAHLTEHMVFKGTKSRSASFINSYIDSLGGELNAYTTKEETVIHSTILKEDLSKAINLIVELALCPVFPEKELEKEKVVILDEINSYKDSPEDSIYEDFEELLFKGSALSNPVLGSEKFVKKCKVKELKEYHQRMFVPQNMCFAVVADIEESKVKKILKAALIRCGASDNFSKREIDINMGEPFKRENIVSKEISKRNHQVHCIIGNYAYSYYQKERIPLILLINILGGPSSNSKLNLALREKNALVYNVEASYNQYSDVGSVTIYFACDKSNYNKCLSLVKKELMLCRTRMISEAKLKEAKKQLLGQLAISEDNGEARCLSMGKSLMVFGKVIEMDEIKSLIDAVTAEQLQSISCDLFDEDSMSILTYK